jgi:hypothetical protein
MTSAINPQNIDGAYPIAGQDNDSQGFRDNFTNTKTNFEFAAAEITDLQNKAILTAPLTGTLSTNNNMNGEILRNMQLQQFYLTSAADLANGAEANTTFTVNYFTTAGSETATLGTGINGQVKILCAANVAAGNMVITVTDAAWGGSGTITFDANGEACTMLYTNSKWFCVGNNGATFA